MTGAAVDGTTTAYTYDSDGLRVAEAHGTSTTRYVTATVNPTGYAQVVEQRTDDGTTSSLDAAYVWGRRLISETRGSATGYYVQDALGSTRALADVAGSVTDTYDYYGYGEVQRRTGTTANVYEFAGEHMDADLGQSYSNTTPNDQARQ
jgi:YD repeat-containing protein